jgi:FRG domain
MARKVFEVAGQKYIVVAYTGFADLGLATDPPRPLAAVPLFDRVEDSLVEPLRRARSLEEDLKVMGFRGVGGLVRALAGDSVAPALPHGNGRLSYEDKSVCPFVLFRGERSYEFSIMPTSYRPLARIPPELHPRIRRRHARIERRLARKIRAAVLISRRTWLTPLQSRAAARHFGAVSTLADFTFDPRVAAYFAHPTFNEADRNASGAGTRPVGIIYGFRYDKLQRCFPIQTFSTEESGAGTFTFQVITDALPRL